MSIGELKGHKGQAEMSWISPCPGKGWRRMAIVRWGVVEGLGADRRAGGKGFGMKDVGKAPTAAQRLI